MRTKSKIRNFLYALKELLADDSDLRTEDDWNAPLFTPSGFLRKLPMRFNWIVCIMLCIAGIFILFVANWLCSLFQ